MKHIDTNENEVELSWSCILTAQKLQISYEIGNLSGEDIYVLDAMFRLEGGAILDSQRVYTIIENDLLTLFRGVLRIPENLQVEAPDVPFARLLRAGGKIKGIIDPPLPLAFHHPYEWNEREELRITHHLRLRIGYLAVNNLHPQPVMKMIGGVEVYYPKYRQVVNIQRFVETPTREGTVDVLIKP